VAGSSAVLSSERRSFSGSIGKLLLVAAVAGALVAGLLLPIVGAVGLGAKAGADSFENLPNSLTVPPLPQASRILAADGSTLASFYYQNRINVRLSAVPRVMREAIVAIEDSRFYEHHGLDFRGITRAAVTNLQSGSFQQGGSTLTQQYVKNGLLASARNDSERRAANAQTTTRKIREARYALALEQQWSKDKILESYLNIAYFGSGAYGVGAAAKHYFNKPVNTLTLPEAALLAGIVRDPSLYNPILHPRTAKLRRDTVLQRMSDLAVITPVQAQRAEAARIALHITQPKNGCIGTRAPFFCDHVVSEIRRDPAFGKTVADRTQRLLRGGLTIRTSLDLNVQKAAQKAILDHVHVKDAVAAVADVVEPGTGFIKALGVNRIYDNNRKVKGHTTVNLTTGGQSGVQGGSTFKIFTLTAALEEGYPLNLQLQCPGTYRSSVFSNNGRPYVVANDEPGTGIFNLFTATWHSVNTCFIQLEERTGTARPIKIAQSMGVANLNGTPLNPGGSFTLGTDSISPLAMAGVYATYAAHGKYCRPTAIVSATDASGHTYPIAKPNCTQVLEAGIADTVTAVLRGVITSGTGRGASISRPAAGKTGTAQGYSAAWFDGYVPQLAATVWMGDPRGSFRHPLKNVRINGHYYGHVFGGTISAPIWGELMRAALKGKPRESFAGPDPSVGAGRQVTVPYVAGTSVGTAKARLAAVGLTGVLAFTQVPSSYPAGTVASSSPGGGSSIGLGSSVLLNISSGAPAPPPSPTPAPTPTPSSASPSPSPSPRPSPSRSRHHRRTPTPTPPRP